MPDRKKEKVPDRPLALAKYRKLAPTYDRVARPSQRLRRLAVRGCAFLPRYDLRLVEHG
jgi:hypothetical protein